MRVYTFLMMDFKEFFANRLKTARMNRGYTQEKLSQVSGVHLKAIAKYETKVAVPSVENLKKLAEALEVSSDYFLFDQAKMKGVPKIKDPDLYEQYFILETLDQEERKGVLTLLRALIASHKLKQLTAGLTTEQPSSTGKELPDSAAL